MNRTTRWLGSAALAASFIFAGSARGALPSADVGNDTIRCGTVIATVSFSPPLAFAGTADSVKIRIKGKVEGCVDVTNPAVVIDSGSFQGTLVGATNDCLALTDVQRVTGSLSYRWKASAETPILQTSSVQTVESLSGAAFVPALANPAFSGTSYLTFTLGTGPVTGAFTGGDAGATSSNIAVTSENGAFFAARCATPAAGIKTLHIGIGTIALR